MSTMQPDGESVSLTTIVREWTRVGVISFGGPPAHIALLRKLCVEDHAWLSSHEFEDGIAATNLLPGPASTQLAIFCAWRLRGRLGGLVGGICFIVPGLAVILCLAALFLAAHPPLWVSGGAAGAGAAVPAVALNAAIGLIPSSWRRVGNTRPVQVRWCCYLLAGALSASLIGPYLIIVLIVCGVIEIVVRDGPAHSLGRSAFAFFPVSGAPAAAGGLVALCWVALKVGALSYGGGFVIIPLMQHDAVVTYHWMSGAQFLNAVALGQITPGPVVQTVAVVGYAAGGLAGGLLAGFIAFALILFCAGWRPALRPVARKPADPDFLDRGRRVGNRGDCRVGHSARTRSGSSVATRAPGPCGNLALRGASRSSARPRWSWSSWSDRRHGRRAGMTRQTPGTPEVKP
jgi:chromate transporter